MRYSCIALVVGYQSLKVDSLKTVIHCRADALQLLRARENRSPSDNNLELSIFVMPELQSTRQKYNSRSEIWADEDRWHRHTHDSILAAVHRMTRALKLANKSLLNLGSGGNEYALDPRLHIQLDLADRHLPQKGLSIVGSAELLPLATHSLDFVLCVGAVLNYCDAAAVICEIARVLKPGGALLLEFESSRSGEYLGRPEFGKAGVFVTTTFQGGPESLWLYNPEYIVGLLKAVDIELIYDEGFHAATAIAFRLFKNEDFAMHFALVDHLSFARRLLRSLACNRIFLAEKGLKGTQASL
jgi:SAM-dependent methyltransferase